MLGVSAIILSVSFSHLAFADNQQEKTKEFYSWFRPGMTAVVDLELPTGEEAKVTKVDVVWSDRRKQTEGLLHVDDHPFASPREVSQTPSTEVWEMIDMLGRTVQLKILLQAGKDGERDEEMDEKGDGRRRWRGVRIETITVHYEYPVAR